MATAIIMPKAGMAMETGTIIEWKCSIGDYIETGDDILEIETDKVAMGVEAETSGYLIAMTHQVGDVVPVTETIGWIGEKGEKAPDAPAPSAEAQPTAAGGGTSPAPSSQDAAPAAAKSTAQGGGPRPATPSDAGRVSVVGDRAKATPQARRLSDELGINLSSVTPTGPAGEIRAADVLGAVQSQGTVPARISPLAEQAAARSGLDLAAVSGSGAGGRMLRRDVVEQATAADATRRFVEASGTLAPSATPVGEQAADTRAALVGMRKVIAQRMLESHRSIPPVTLNAVADVDALARLRAEINGGAGATRKFSYNDFLLLATAKAVRECPWMRVSLDGESVVERGAVNIGMAVALEQGLIVPVIHHADGMTISELADRSRDLATRARERKLEIDEMQGGTFTVTNLGMYGITTFTPIINPPEAAILGVGRIREELYLAAEGRAAARQVIDLSLTADHRLIDGAQGALFLKRLIELLENPATILV